jgi:hypothetical protein
VSGHVFKDDPSQGGAEFIGDPGDMGPEVAGVVCPKPLACHAERLAGVSGKQGVDGPGDGSGVKSGEVVPDWRGGKVSGALCCDDGRSRVGFPFDKGAGVETGLGKHEAHIQASAACAEGQPVSGTWHHVIQFARA